MGQTGSASQLAGYGYHAGAIAGFYEVTGWPDLAPNGPWVAYTDTVAPRFIFVLLAATRMGNRSPYAAPQGCYPCAGDDEWVAIGVDTDAEWLRLCRVIGRADLAADAGLSTVEGRRARHDEIDVAIADWSRVRPPVDAMAELQAASVPAGHVQRSRNLLEDRQYRHRGFYHWFDHPEMGHIPYAGHPYRIRGYDNGPRGPAPTLGQHTFEVLSQFLGLDDEQIASAYASGAVG
jgi:crotonobetainyl-CoA:carnitine CoA-transferase CaiB-like acyl-CoA transferase